MDKVKLEKLKIGDVLQDDKGVRYLVSKIDWGQSWIMAIDSHFRSRFITHDFVKVFLYYVETLDIKKVISFLQGHEWWNDLMRRQQMTNEEKLREVFPKTIFIQKKEEDKTTALMISDEWLESEYIDPSHEEVADE